MARLIRTSGCLWTPTVQQPRCLRHHARGGLHGDYPRPAILGVHRYVSSVISSASHGLPYLAKNHLSRVQTRVLCMHRQYLPGNRGQPENKEQPSFSEGKNRLDAAIGKLKESSSHDEAKKLMLQGLDILEKLAADEHYCCDEWKANLLFCKVVLPLRHDLDDHAFGSIIEASLRVTCLLLQTAPGEIGTKLRSKISRDEKIKRSMEMIRDTNGCDDNKRKLAEKILAQLPSTPN